MILRVQNEQFSEEKRDSFYVILKRKYSFISKSDSSAVESNPWIEGANSSVLILLKKGTSNFEKRAFLYTVTCRPIGQDK